jgi:hypothetical protein
VLVPVLEKAIDLSQANFEPLNSPHPMAFDDRANRLYVSLSPSRMVVLDVNTGL